MGYDLGVDIGTSFTAAALREDGGTVRVVGLGPITDSIPSVLYLDDDGSMVVGDAANRRALLDARGVAREFKRRLGDPTPILLRGSPFSAEALMARVLRHVVDRVTEREGDPPRSVVVTHPANWGRFRLEIFEQVAQLAGLEGARFLTEPVAAAVAHGVDAELAEGASIAVYDLGGGTFDSAVVRRTGGGFEVLGQPVGLEHAGGLDFDAAIVDLVMTRLPSIDQLDAANPEHVIAMAHLRRSCVQAKEVLSVARTATVPVVLPGFDGEVTVSRSDFESKITALVASSISSLEQAVTRADLETVDLSAILVVGGSSRVPIVPAMLREAFGDLVHVAADPVHMIARGAAMAAAEADAPSAGAPPPRPTTTVAPPPRLQPAPAPPPAPLPNPPLGRTEPTAAGTESRGDERSNGPRPSVAPTVAATPANVPPSQPATGLLEVGAHERDDGAGRVRWVAAVAGLLLIGAVGYGLVRLASPGQDAAQATIESDGGDQDDGAVEVAGTQQGRAMAASPTDMVEIAGGTFPLGLDQPESNTSESLTREAEVATFHIDAYEVTNADYKAFIDRTGASPPASWRRGAYPEALADHPVSGVSFEWAAAYCTAVSKRLPTETEWEVAARGDDGRVWPWGDDASAVELPTSGTYPVGSVAGNVSPFGVFDLAGNVWEWVTDPYDQRVDDDLRVLRGGQNGFLRENVTRLPVDPLHSSAIQTAGFRCAADGVDAGTQDGVFVDYDPPSRSNEPVEVPLPTGVVVYDNFTDSTSGWSEMSVEGEFRLGYHPNEYLHLETRDEFEEALALSPWRANPDEGFAMRTTAFVEPSLTTEGGTFGFGLAFSFDDSGRGLVFLVDERNSTWTFAAREVTGDGPYGAKGAEYVIIEQGSRSIPADVELEVIDLGDDVYELRINGAAMHTRSYPGYDGTGAGLVLLSNDDSDMVHIHFDEFQVNELS